MSGSLLRPDFRTDIADLRRRIEQLERRTTPRPTTVATATSDVLTAELQIIFGSYTHARHTVALVPDATATIPGGPITLAAGGKTRPRIVAPTFSSGSIDLVATFIVYSGDVSQRSRGIYEVSLSSGETWEPGTGEGSFDMGVGSDLLTDNGQVQSTSGGRYLATLVVVFSSVPS